MTQDHFLRLFQEVYGMSKAKQRAALTHLFLPDGTIRKSIKKRIVQRVAELDQCVDMGVFCLTEVPGSILMWSHYATAHTGMCVGFERNKDNAFVNDGICLPVTYSRNYLTVDTMRIFILIIRSSSIIGILLTALPNMLLALFCMESTQNHFILLPTLSTYGNVGLQLCLLPIL